MTQQFSTSEARARAHARSLLLTTLGAVAMAQPACAQTPPDAGSLLRQQPRPPVLAPAKPTKIEPAGSDAQRPEDGSRVMVRGFRIQGALLFSEAELQAQLKELVGKALSFRQLEGAAAILSSYYTQHGYLARVFPPPQDVKDGIVTLQIVEGRRGGVHVISRDSRIDGERVAAFVEYRLGRGETFDLNRLGEALSVLNEQPGLSVRSSLAPGQGEAEIDLNVTALGKPWLSGNVVANNNGSTSTGEPQVGGGIILNNTTGHLDALSLIANVSHGSRFGRLDYSTALGDSGLRAGLNTSYMRYRVVQSTLAALDSHGNASTAGIAASYPLARRRSLSLSAMFNLDAKRLVDDTVAGETSHRQVTVGGLAIEGQLNGAPESPWADAAMQFGLGLSLGRSNQRNASALAADADSRQVQGRYGKLSYSLAYLQPLAGAWRVNAALRGQFADKNLDSAERFSLGGPDGVRGYPVGEATGDQGWTLSLDLARQLNAQAQASVFIDQGHIRLNHRTWAGWNAASPALRNSYGLSSAGIGLVWRVVPQAVLTASLARALGHNPGADANGRNADGADGRTRAWIAVNATF